MRPLKRILHVEDDQDILDVAGICLATVGGFELAQFTHGAIAVEHAATFKPDLFLLDMMMPVMDGVETLQNLRMIEHLGDIPAIFVTAKNLAQTNIQAELGENVIGIIEKPFEAVQLAENINRMWDDYQRQSMERTAAE
jgi:two-component system, OmpR family, response regulator